MGRRPSRIGPKTAQLLSARRLIRVPWKEKGWGTGSGGQVVKKNVAAMTSPRSGRGVFPQKLRSRRGSPLRDITEEASQRGGERKKRWRTVQFGTERMGKELWLHTGWDEKEGAQGSFGLTRYEWSGRRNEPENNQGKSPLQNVHKRQHH